MKLVKNKILAKFYLATISSVLVGLFVIVILMSLLIGRYMAMEKKQLLQQNCKTVVSVVSQYMGNKTLHHLLNGITTVISDAIDSDVFISDTTGNVIICSCNEKKTTGNCIHSSIGIPSEILAKVNKSEFFEVGNFNGNYNSIYYTVGMPVVDDNKEVLGIIFASMPASNLEQFAKDISQLFFISAIIPVFVLFVVVYTLSYRMIKPLHLMSQAAKNMSKGDFSKRIPVYGNDEITELAIAFNEMTDSLVLLEKMRRSFIANVSHELKTPMTTISGFIDGIIDGTINPKDREYYLGIISQEVKRLSRLVQSMLNLSKLESGEMKVNFEKTDIVKIICEVVVSQEQRISEKNITIKGLENLGKVFVLADKDLIYQALYNIIDNAIKFTNNDGFIIISVVENEDNTVLIKTKNSGIGIKPEDIKFIFDRFYKGDKSRSVEKNSLGLGLYITKSIVKLHKGKITVRSIYGESTEFYIILPKS